MRSGGMPIVSRRVHISGLIVLSRSKREISLRSTRNASLASADFGLISPVATAAPASKSWT